MHIPNSLASFHQILVLHLHQAWACKVRTMLTSMDSPKVSIITSGVYLFEKVLHPLLANCQLLCLPLMLTFYYDDRLGRRSEYMDVFMFY